MPGITRARGGVLVALMVAAFVACEDASTRITYDGLEQMSFEGRDYLGYEDAIDVAPGLVQDVGEAVDVHSYVEGYRVFALPNVDPRRAVVMQAGAALSSDYTLFVERSVLRAIGQRDFGAGLAELCPYLRALVLRYGCPGAPTRPPTEPGV